MHRMNDNPHRRWEEAERRADRIMRGLDPDPVAPPLEQLPLFPASPRAEPYPINTLGPSLAPAARAIASKVQVPDAIAANSVLAAASLAVQAHADVRLPYGQTRPTSLFILTIAGSGDRKTTADHEALLPVWLRENALQELHQEHHRSFSIAYAAWAAEKRKIESNRKLDLGGRKNALVLLGAEPEPPLHPFLVVPDPTYEGLVKAWPTAPASLGVFSSEGGQFIGGHGLAPENRLRTATGFSELWDGKTIKRVRAQDGVSLLRGRRLTLHLMAQQDVSALLLGDELLRNQGLLSRLLIAAPDSLAGGRRYREPRLEDEIALQAYTARLLPLLETSQPVSSDRSMGLSPRVLTLSSDAASLWKEFFDAMEEQIGPAGRYRAVSDLAAKIAEHAARIAGVLAIVDDPDASAISDASMASAVILAEWYLEEAARLQSACRADAALLKAKALLDWLRMQATEEVLLSDVLQRGPNATRTKREAEAALAILKAHGWVEDASSRPRSVRLLRAGAVQ